MTTVLTGRRVPRGGALNDDVDIARDHALITRAQDGDRSAFDELYLLYYRRLYRLCLRRLSDAYEAEDAAQESFVRAWRALPRFSGERRFYPWLSVIASNLCTDLARRRARTTPVAEFFGADVSSADDAPDARLVAADDARTAGAAFDRLTERHRRVLELREGQGLSYQAIADHEGLALSAVETLLWRARQALRREFAALAGADGRLAGVGILAGVAAMAGRALRLPAGGARRLVRVSPASAAVTLGSATAALLVVSGAVVPHPGAPTHPVTVTAPGPAAAGGLRPGTTPSGATAPGATAGGEASPQTPPAPAGTDGSAPGAAATPGSPTTGPAQGNSATAGVTTWPGAMAAGADTVAGSPPAAPGTPDAGATVAGIGATLGGLLDAVSGPLAGAGGPSSGPLAGAGALTTATTGVGTAAGAAVGSAGAGVTRTLGTLGTAATAATTAAGTAVAGIATPSPSVAGGVTPPGAALPPPTPPPTPTSPATAGGLGAVLHTLGSL